MYTYTCVYTGGVGITTKRKSILIDDETKAVFDYSMLKEGTRNFSEHIRKLLGSYHKKEWPELLKDARICEKHGKPYTIICKDCELALCPECNIDLHQNHNVQFFCRIHQVGYQTTCMLCERDRWEGIVEIPLISADELVVKLKSKKVIFIDVRGDTERSKGYLPGSHHTKWIFFRLKNTEEHKNLEDLIKENKDKLWIFISQGSSKNPSKPARAWLAAADIKTMYHINEVVCLEGGWSYFHSKFPDIVEYPADSSHKLESRRS
ncbi:MAG: hypothetical protein MUO43_06830 [Desulfobacterales bacterium]|nr:hypothetical protein [Desulfobacterales bacterium]